MAKMSIGEVVYQGIKARITSGAYLPGDRLELHVLADDLQSSITPVRAALCWLAGEKLVEGHARDGFNIPHITGHGLRDRYVAVETILVGAVAVISTSGNGFDDGGDGRSPAKSSVVTRTERLFHRIAAASGNDDFAELIDGYNHRLRSVRKVEANILADRREEIEALEKLFAARDYPELVGALTAYHRRRQRVANSIAEQAHRQPNRRPRKPRDQPPLLPFADIETEG